MFPNMSFRMELTHLWAEQHKVMVGWRNNTTSGITFLVGRGYSQDGIGEKNLLSVHPLCCNSDQTGRSFKDQLKSPPIIMGPVHVLAAVRLGLKFIGSLLIKTATSVLEWRGISINRDTKDFQRLSLNSTHGKASFVSIDPLLLTDVVNPHGEARDHCNSTWSR